MATYIPGVQGYYPEFEPFVPDYKFLSGVLDQRTDRYNTNYKALNDLYSKVVYADLTRDDSIEMRDQYANLLAPKLEQVASMDLSIQQNVDAAKALFQPFYDNDLIVKDLVATQQYKKELGYANSLLESSDKKTREQYWQTGVEAMQYQMQDFKQADPGKALKMGLPKYVPNVNLFDMSMQVLKDAGLSVEQSSFDPKDPHKTWIIKQKNGSLVTPIAFETVKRTLLDDPRLINAYYTDAYVKSRKFAEDGMAQGQFTTVDEGRTAWANNIIADIQAKTLRQNEKTQTKVKEADDVKKNWEQYQQQYGVVPGSDEDLAMVEALAKYDGERARLKSEEDILQESQDPAPSDETLISKAYNMLMSYNISDDMMAAAKAFSMKDASLTFEANPYRTMELEHEHDFAKMRMQFQHDKDMADYKLKKDMQLEDYKNRFASMISAAFNPLALLGNEKTTIGDKDGDGELDTDFDVVEFNKKAQAAIMNDVAKSKIDAIKKAHIATESLKADGGKPQMITIETQNGKQMMDMNQFEKEMLKPGNERFLADVYSSYKNKINNVQKENPLLLNADNNKTFRELKNSFLDADTKMSAVVSGEKEMAKVYNDNLQNVIQTEYGKPIKEMQEKGIPMIVTSPTKKAFDYQEALKNAPTTETPMQRQARVANATMPDDFTNWFMGGAQPRLLTKEEYRNDFAKKYNAGQIKGVSPKTMGSDISNSPSARATTAMGGWLVLNLDESGRVSGQSVVDMADEHYNAQIKILNKTLNGAITPTRTADGKETGVFKTFGFDQWMRGAPVNEMTTGSITTFPTYSTFVNPAALDEKSATALADFAKQYVNSPNAVVISGDLTGVSDTPTTSDENAKKILGQAILDMQKAALNPKPKENEKTPTLRLTYAPVYGAPSGDRQNAAYVLEFDKEYIKTFASSEDKAYIGNNEVDDYTKITMMFPRETDLSSRNAEAYNFSFVQNNIQRSPERNYTYVSPNGGKLNVFQDGNNWMYNMSTLVYDPKTSNLVTQDILPAMPLSYADGSAVKRNDLDRIVNGLQYTLDGIAEENTKAMNLYKRNIFAQLNKNQ